jgi:alkylated DNA repair dioxygenase AlkB
MGDGTRQNPGGAELWGTLEDPTLDVVQTKGWVDNEIGGSPHDAADRKKASEQLWEDIAREVPFFRVSYRSARHGRDCVTPCWTNAFGGPDENYVHFQPIPECLDRLRRRLERELSQNFNVVLVRLYANGADEIAWHTDGRQFLGTRTSVASVSLGAPRKFQMRRVDDLWPDVSGSQQQQQQRESNRVGPTHTWPVRNGDLFLMQGQCQRYWHHRVPAEARLKSVRANARINLNFRYVRPGPHQAQGMVSYYKYCVVGDNATIPHEKARYYRDILSEDETRQPSVASFFGAVKKPSSAGEKRRAPEESASSAAAGESTAASEDAESAKRSRSEVIG